MKDPSLDKMAEKNKGEAPETTATTQPYKFGSMYEAEESIGRLLNRCVEWLSTPRYRYAKLRDESVGKAVGETTQSSSLPKARIVSE